VADCRYGYILTDSRPIGRLEIVDTGRRRRWPEEAKVRIVEESLSGPRLASATARRHGISNQLLFSWRKAYRAGRLGAPAGFVPAMIAEEPSAKGGESPSFPKA
jgi:transposase